MNCHLVFEKATVRCFSRIPGPKITFRLSLTSYLTLVPVCRFWMWINFQVKSSEIIINVNTSYKRAIIIILNQLLLRMSKLFLSISLTSIFNIFTNPWEIPLPGRGIVDKNRSTQSKTTVRSRREFQVLNFSSSKNFCLWIYNI